MRRPRYRTIPPKPMTDRVREKILDVAARLFASQGYAGASTDQVIADCGIGRDTFYRRFASKLELFEAVALRERERTDRLFSEFTASHDGTPLEQLEAAARWLLDVNLNPDLIAMKRIAFNEARLFGRAAQDAPSPIIDHLVDLVRRLQAEGVLRVGEPSDIVGFIINTLVLAPMMEAMLAENPVHDAAWRGAYFDRTWPRILRGLS